MPTLHSLVLAQDDRLIGLELADVAVDGRITKTACGVEVAGESPVDRGKLGLKRSVVVDATGAPLAVVAAGANRHVSPIPTPTLDDLVTVRGNPATITVRFDRDYDHGVPRALLDDMGFTGEIARKSILAPIQAR